MKNYERGKWWRHRRHAQLKLTESTSGTTCLRCKWSVIRFLHRSARGTGAKEVLSKLKIHEIPSVLAGDFFLLHGSVLITKRSCEGDEKSTEYPRKKKDSISAGRKERMNRVAERVVGDEEGGKRERERGRECLEEGLCAEEGRFFKGWKRLAVHFGRGTRRQFAAAAAGEGNAGGVN